MLFFKRGSRTERTPRTVLRIGSLSKLALAKLGFDLGQQYQRVLEERLPGEFDRYLEELDRIEASGRKNERPTGGP